MQRGGTSRRSVYAEMGSDDSDFLETDSDDSDTHQLSSSSSAMASNAPSSRRRGLSPALSSNHAASITTTESSHSRVEAVVALQQAQALARMQQLQYQQGGGGGGGGGGGAPSSHASSSSTASSLATNVHRFAPELDDDGDFRIEKVLAHRHMTVAVASLCRAAIVASQKRREKRRRKQKGATETTNNLKLNPEPSFSSLQQPMACVRWLHRFRALPLKLRQELLQHHHHHHHDEDDLGTDAHVPEKTLLRSLAAGSHELTGLNNEELLNHDAAPTTASRAEFQFLVKFKGKSHLHSVWLGQCPRNNPRLVAFLFFGIFL